MLQVSFALLDVFTQEPLPADSPLWRQRGVRITPHVASMTTLEVGEGGRDTCMLARHMLLCMLLGAGSTQAELFGGWLNERRKVMLHQRAAVTTRARPPLLPCGID